MGSVKIDIFKKERMWFDTNLSDKECIKGLLKYRRNFDLLFNRESDNVDVYTTNVDLNNQKEEVLCLYVWLDDIIEKTKFTQQQERILHMVMYEYSIDEMAKINGCTPQNVNRIINTICKKLSLTVQREWRKKVYIKKLGLKTKRCSKCGENFPATEEFFTPDNTKASGFKSSCKICR